jgi:hypothetical protein
LKEEKITMKTGYKFILTLLICLVCGCPRSSTSVDAGCDVLDVPHGAVTSSDSTVANGSVEQ